MAVRKGLDTLVIAGIFCGFLRLASTVEVTLIDSLDTKNGGGSLNWVTHSRTRSQPGVRVGWREGSYNLPNGDTTRVYTVCNVDFEGVDNWFRTPYINRGDAHRLYIELRFTMRKCTRYPDPEMLQQCKESFKLLYYEAESDFANDMMPTWDTDTYKHVDVVAADQTFTSINDAVINTEVRSIEITRKGVYFAIHDQGACTTLISIRIYYIKCPATVRNFAVFSDTPTGPEPAGVQTEDGVCVPHSAIERPPSYLCKADGSWYFLNGGCKCMPGYEPVGDKSCSACSIGKYKWRTGSYACNPCPEHSVAPNNGSVECHCEDGYFRNVLDDKAMACTKPPTELRNLTLVSVSQTAINVSWMHPEDFGGRREIWYNVDCFQCTGSVEYRPRKKKFNTTWVYLSGLTPGSQYTVTIEVENGVSSLSGVRRAITRNIATEEALPSKVQNFRFVSIGRSHITIKWDPPVEHNSMKMDGYEIKTYPNNEALNASFQYTTDNNFTFKELIFNRRYSFEVRAHTAKGWGEYSHPISGTVGEILTDSGDVNKIDAASDSPVAIITGSAIAVVLCMSIVIIMVIIFLRRNHRACNEKNVSDCDTLQYSNVHSLPVYQGTHVLNGLTVPLFSPPGTIRSYIDPHTYEDPNQAVREFTKEIDASLITIESVIGGGEFGDVCKGKLRLPNKGDLVVAIKTLKAGASDKNRLDFLTEASIMGQFDDPNVIYLEGVVTKSNPIMIVTEYMENGSLDTFLRNNDGKFTVIQLVGMMRGVASGMRYLSDMGYVHRDLAARNILVNESLVCKVADFGLSREIESDTTEGAYTTKGGKIPVRWTAPEAIAYRKFTSASDVWSYGVVKWEIMSYGERPYWNWSNQDVIKAVDKGFRLPPPMDCPEAIYQLMLDCWQKERAHRPKFAAIVKTLDKLIRSPELLRKIAKPRQHDYFDPNVPDMTSYETIEEWLTAIKMDRYTDHFLSAGVTSMDQVSSVTLKDLLTLNITLVGHQKKIMNSIQTLRAQKYGAQVLSEGYLV